MTAREIKTARKLLESVGRRVTGTIVDERGRRPTAAIETDGDGHTQYSGTPRVFSSLAEVREYVAARTEGYRYQWYTDRCSGVLDAASMSDAVAFVAPSPDRLANGAWCRVYDTVTGASSDVGDVPQQPLTAARRDAITDQQIRDRLAALRGLSVHWSGPLPHDAEDWESRALATLCALTVADVRAALARHDLAGNHVEVLDAAIALACRPAGLPDSGAVVLL